MRKQLREAEKASSNWVSMLRSGAIWQGGFVQISIQQQTNSPVLSRNGWQQKASDVVENVSWPGRSGPLSRNPSKPSSRSQQGPMAGLPFTSLPLSAETTFQSQEFRVLFSSLPLATFASVFVHLPMRPTTRLSWPSSRSVSVGRGVGAPGIRVGKCSSPRLPEAGGRVTTNVLVQDMDLLPHRQVDNRRLEVVVDGLPTVQGSATGH